MATFRSCIFSLGYFFLTVFYGTLALPCALLPNKPRHKIICTWTTVVVLWLRLTCGVRYRVKGLENLRAAELPAVILAKHQSTWETFFLQGLFWPASTILKKELLKIPFFGWGLRALYPIAIDRDNPRAALRQVKAEGAAHLRNGFNIIVFPEGTRVQRGEKANYARSGADIALDGGARVIPVALNAGSCWPPKSFAKFPGTICVSIGPQIATAGKSSKEITAEAERWIESEMALIDR